MRGLGVRVFCLLFDKEQDADVIERMERRPSTMTSYVRELVRRDMHDEQLRKTATMLASARADLLAENAKLRELAVLQSVIFEHMSTCPTTDCQVCPVNDECDKSIYLEGVLGIDDKETSWLVQWRSEDAADVRAENAKLRELVADAWGYINHPADATWTHKKRKEVRDSIADHMRELGIEVDE